MGNDLTNAEALFAGTSTSTASISFALFQALYNAFFTPFQNGATSVMSSLISPMAGMLTLGATLMFGLWAVAVAMNSEDVGNVLGRALTRVLLPFAVVGFLLSSTGTYQQYVTGWVMKIPDDIIQITTGSVGGQVINSGSPFDAIANTAFAAGAKVFGVIPVSLKGVVLAIIVIIYWLAAGASIGVAFALFLVSKALMYLLAALSPIFVFCGAFQPARFLTKGFVSAAAGNIVAQIIVAVILGIALTVEKAVLTPILAGVDTTNIIGLLMALVEAGVALFICAILAWNAPRVSIGIAGGVFDGIATWIAAAGGAAHALKAAVAGGGSTSGSSGATASSRPFSTASRGP